LTAAEAKKFIKEDRFAYANGDKEYILEQLKDI
jgi:hypothetical protein